MKNDSWCEFDASLSVRAENQPVALGMRYSLFGLHVDAHPAVPGLVPLESDAPPDVVYRLETIDNPRSAVDRPTGAPWYESQWRDDRTGEPGLRIYRSSIDGSFLFLYADGVEFMLRAGGDYVVGRMPPNVTIADMATYLTGPVLGVLLRIRGVVSLHASVIEVADSAVAFVGDAGAGKSTTAAMFVQLGYRVITEDVAALSCEGGRLMVRPGCAKIALCPDAVSLLYGSSEALPPVSPGWDKRRLDLTARGAFADRPLPLGAVYLLEPRSAAPAAPCVSPISRRQAMVHLLGNIYGNQLLHEELRTSELDTVHHLAATVPIKTATADQDGTSLEKFCSIILEDFRCS
jgi:hypothetical protein